MLDFLYSVFSSAPLQNKDRKKKKEKKKGLALGVKKKYTKIFTVLICTGIFIWLQHK